MGLLVDGGALHQLDRLELRKVRIKLWLNEVVPDGIKVELNLRLFVFLLDGSGLFEDVLPRNILSLNFLQKCLISHILFPLASEAIERVMPYSVLLLLTAIEVGGRLLMDNNAFVVSNQMLEVIEGSRIIFGGPLLKCLEPQRKLMHRARFVKSHTLREESHSVDFLSLVKGHLLLDIWENIGVIAIRENWHGGIYI